MKLAFFDDYKLGVVVGDKIVDVSAVTKGIKALGPQDVIRGVIENFGALKGKLAAAAKKGKGKPLSKVKLRPPLPKPTIRSSHSATNAQPPSANVRRHCRSCAAALNWWR